jgi:hypothetical protein
VNTADLSQGLWPWFVLIVFGFLPSEIWRVLSVFLARGIDESSELLVWVRAVATALLAGVVAKLLLSPNGALAVIPVWGRIGALVIGMAAFALGRKSLIAAIVTAEITIVALGYWVTAH